MSGPIVRKYGFPNFDQIFGSRPIPHGEDEAAESPVPSDAPAGQPAKKTTKAKAEASAEKPKKSSKPKGTKD